ncbi:MAG: TolC family protein [Planctomycetota bacterium]|nr:TolC family protein [Planctomycetota bacterium]
MIRRGAIWLLVLAGCATSSSDEWSAWTPAGRSREALQPAPPAIDGNPALRSLLEIALERNPRIAAARARAAAAAETPAIDGALPDPKVMLGWYETSVETRVGPQDFSAGIQQAVPFPQKLRLRARLGGTLADRARVEYEAVVRDVLVDVVRTAHELVYLDRAARISNEIGMLLERYVALAASGEDASLLNELFRAETQRAQLENDRVVLRELQAVERETLRILLGLRPGTPVGTPTLAATPDVNASFEELLAIALRYNQGLQAAGISTRAAALRTDLARADRLPDLTLGFTHIATGNLPASIGNPAGNGDDPQIAWLGFTLPVWAGKNAAKIRRARQLEHAAAADRASAENRVRTRLARVWFEVGNARRLVRLYETVLVPRAETAARTAEDLRAAGKGTLAGALETAAVLQNFRLAAARARADYGRAVAELESILGQPLEREDGRQR